MIATRILDNDMGEVAKVPLTGRGTVHGVTVELDVVINHSKDKDGKLVTVTKRFTLPEFDVGLLEILSADRGVSRFVEHVKQKRPIMMLPSPDAHAEVEKQYVEAYTNWVTWSKK